LYFGSSGFGGSITGGGTGSGFLLPVFLELVGGTFEGATDLSSSAFSLTSFVGERVSPNSLFFYFIGDPSAFATGST